MSKNDINPPDTGQPGALARLVTRVDALSTVAGRMSSWLLLVLTVVISVEVVSRYVFGWPLDWVFDTSYMLYGTTLLMAGAYALAKDAHVRGDLLYGEFSPRMQASLDLMLYLLFFVPGVLALIVAGYHFAAESWAIREHSSLTPDGPPIYPLKMVIPIAGALLLLQGASEMLRCGLCIARGTWPERAPDFEPVDIDKLRSEIVGTPDHEAGVRP